MSLACALLLAAAATDGAPEEAYWRALEVPQPEDVVLEVSGIALLPDGRPLVATRRGEVFVVDHIDGTPEDPPVFHRFAEGLQEPLGLLVHDGWIYAATRGELCRMRDVDGDDRVDEIETVCDAWRVGGNYHEYNFGPRLDPEGYFWITTNRPFGERPFGAQPWRGFALRVSPTGEMLPTCCGLRSPAGIEISPEGLPFYTDNQGEWCNASKLSLLVPGKFYGHPFGLDSCELPEWRHPKPAPLTDHVLMAKLPELQPTFQMPAVWFPYDEMGRSPCGFVWDTTGGRFGPFTGQVFVGDQFQASVIRVTLEEVEGHWQGACYPFRVGLPCGVTRLAWLPDGSLLAGMTDRGWPSLGPRSDGLVRLVWTGEVPFEIREMRAEPGGFELETTRPLDPDSALDPASYRMESWTYWHQSEYGSPKADVAAPAVEPASLSEDGRRVCLHVDGLREGYVHALFAEGLRSADGEPLLHPRAYYTLIRRPR